MALLLNIFIAFLLDLCVSGESIMRHINDGYIEGFISERVSGQRVEQYLGIPYAKPPVGDLRFEAPERPIPWGDAVLNVTELPSACVQYDKMYYINEHNPTFNESSEDCLYINLYVPHTSTDEGSPFPILIYIHGGSNRVGMGSMLEGDIMAGHNNMIVVTFNYRLGIFGFLAARNEGLTGTYGFLDQIMVMQWVQENIEVFGGDPNLVTIDGHSAGAANVGFHVVSPLSRGLFKRAIIHSGSPLGLWAMTNPIWPIGYNIYPNCDTNPCEGIGFKEFMRNKQAEDIRKLKGYHTPHDLITFPAVIDGAYLTDYPETTFRSGIINAESFMMAFARDEGFPVVKELEERYASYYTSASLIDDSVNEYSPVYPGVCNFLDVVYQEYRKNRTYTNSQLLNQIEADLLFFSPMIKLANILSQRTDDIYIFSFDHRSSLAKHAEWRGIPHGIDLFFLFGVPLVGHALNNYTDLDIKASKAMMTVWGNFIRHGTLSYNGTDFATYNVDTKAYNRLYSRNEDINVDTQYDFRRDKMTFWNEIITRLNCPSERDVELSNVEKLTDHMNHSSSPHYLCVLMITLMLIISRLLLI